MTVHQHIALQSAAALKAWEAKQFRKWLLSPLHNTRPELLQLFDFLREHLQKGSEVSEKSAFETVFPGQIFDEAKLRHALSWLMKQFKAFFVWQQTESDPYLSNLYAARSFRARGLEQAFRQNYREGKQVLDQAEVFTTEAQLAGFHLDFEQYQWEVVQKRAQEMPFEVLSGALTTYFTTKMLQLGCMYRAQEALGKQAPGALPRLDAILHAFPADTFLEAPDTALYYYGFQMLSQPDDTEWPRRFRALFEQHSRRFPVDEARDLLMMAINHGIRRINRGEQGSRHEVLTLYKIGLDKRLLLGDHGYLSKYTYNNVLLTMVASQLWEQAAQFLEDYRDQLPPAERDGIYRYNKAVYLFRKADYGNAQEILRALSFADPMYNLEARRMLLRIYYEENSFDALESLLDNLLTWLRRHGEIGYHREMYRNLARFTGKLLKIPYAEREKRQKLAKKIGDTPLVADRAWLLEKVGNIEQKNIES